MSTELVDAGEVVSAVERSIHPTPVAEIPLRRCWRAVLARNVEAAHSVPPHDNSAMDGYAVRAEDTTAAAPDDPVALRVVGRSFAGVPPSVPCAPGDAIEIATGAVLPAGADTVVRTEEVEKDGEEILLRAPVELGHDIRHQGEDVEAGDRVLDGGTVLGVVQLAAAAACGHRSLPVHRRAHVTLVVTGDEIAQGATLDPGMVPDALGPSLAAAMAADGPADVDVAGPVGDDGPRLAATLLTAAAVSDLIITVGGVSVGPRDRVAEVVADLGYVERWSVAVKPGKPFAMGRVDETPVLCLPGNPVAALVCHELFVRPALSQLAGRPFRPEVRRARLTAGVRGADQRLHLVRGQLSEDDGQQIVVPVGPGGAGRIATVGAANAWILVPAGTDTIDAGAYVDVRAMAGT